MVAEKIGTITGVKVAATRGLALSVIVILLYSRNIFKLSSSYGNIRMSSSILLGRQADIREEVSIVVSFGVPTSLLVLAGIEPF